MTNRHNASIFSLLVLGACTPDSDDLEFRATSLTATWTEPTTEPPGPPEEDPANCLNDPDPGAGTDSDFGSETMGESGSESGDTTDGSGVCGNGIVEYGEECDDANDSVWDHCHECQVTRVMFATESVYDGAIWPEFGVYSADHLCGVAAPEGSGPWQAWISQPGNTVLDRVDTTFAGRYIRSDGRVIAEGFDDLTDGFLARPINHNEYGQCVGGIDGAWTGTTHTGTLASGHCTYWGTNSSSVLGGIGVLSATDSRWSNLGPVACDNLLHLICLQGYNAPPAVCGDGVVEGPEECDQGASPDGITCNAQCIVPVYTAAALDYQDMENSDASVWSYRYSDDAYLDGDYPLLSDFGAISFAWSPISAPTSVWNTGNGGDPPYVGINDTGHTLTYAGVTLPPGALDVHPPNGGLVVVSWLSDGDHWIDAHANLQALDPSCGDGVEWFIAKNDWTLESGSYDIGGHSSDVSALNIPVTEGDRIHFIVHSSAGYACDSTWLDALIKT